MRCRRCHKPILEWRKSNLTGEIHSFTEVVRAPSAAFRGDAPYFIALVDIDEGFRIMVNIPDAESADVAIGQRVRIFFEQRSESIFLPQAVPV